MTCCNGQTDCNKIITIGYLKDFTNGLVQNDSGIAQTVNLSALPESARTDSYCPTYAQLTSGFLIPNFSDGGNGKWSQNVDGISINGVYDSTQCVRQQDLIVTYTRFELLSVTATPSSDISACGGNSTMSYTYKLRKYIKSMNGNCSINTSDSIAEDTSDSGDAAIVYTSNQAWATVSKPIVTIVKNDSGLPSRTVVITGSIIFRGASHSATATIVQTALTGGYQFWYHDSEIESYDSVSVSPTHFYCLGGDWTSTGYYTLHEWDVYRWQDDCGVYYDDNTEIRNNTRNTRTEAWSAGTAPSISCQTLANKYEHTEVIDYHGKTASWAQECYPCTGDCQCGETCRTETIHSGGTIPCTGGSVDITYDYDDIHVTCDPVTGERTEELVASGRNVYYATVYANECNKTSNPIQLEYGVVQEAGPCCPSSTAYTYADVIVDCHSSASYTDNVAWTCVTINPDTTTSTTYGNSVKTIVARSCNPDGDIRQLQAGNTGTTAQEANPRIIQQAGPCCCSCNDLTLNNGTVSSAGGTNILIGTYNSNTCVTNLTATSSDESWLPSNSITFNNGNIYGNVSGWTSTTVTRTATITVNGSVAGCPWSFTVTQNLVGCTCEMLTLDKSSLSWAWNGTGITSSVTITYDPCISTPTYTTALTHFNVSATQGTNQLVLTFSPKSENTTTTANTGTCRIDYTANGNPCHKDITLTQDAYVCSCNNLSISTSEMVWTSSETASKTRVYAISNANCISNISVSSTNNWFNVTLNTSTNTIQVTPSGQNQEVTAKTGNIILTYNSVGVAEPCSAVTPVRQNAYGCSCDDLILTSAYGDTGHMYPSTSGSNVIVGTYNGGACFSRFEPSVEYGDAVITSITLNNGNIVASISENSGIDVRHTTITVKAANSDETLTCIQTIDFYQDVPPCDCTKLTITPKND